MVRVPLRLKRALRPLHLWPAPRIPLFQRAVIELQSHCNRDCYFCCRESDTTGKRKRADGSSVKEAMPTDKVMALLDEMHEMGFCGYITFHQLSEAFLDKRLMTVAKAAKQRGMRPYVHTNGDVLRDNDALCRDAAETFEYIVVGLYDYTTEAEKLAEQAFWQARLAGADVRFSLVEKAYVRTHSADSREMEHLVRLTHPTAPCAQPLTYLLVHYNGDVACCCEDTYGELLSANVYESSLRDIWASAQHSRVADALRLGNRSQYELCARCTMGGSQYRKDPLTALRHLD